MLQLPLCIDAPFEHFKQGAYKPSQKLHCIRPNVLIKAMYACSNIMEIAPDSLVCLASGIISKPSISEHMHKEKLARHAKTQSLLFLQMSLLEVDSAYAW